MKRFIGLVFSLFFGHRHQFSIINKYHIGDICSWNFNNVQHIIRLINWSKYYDKDTNTESILYEGVDINNHKIFADIDESELNLLAFNDEIVEMTFIVPDLYIKFNGIHLFS